MLVESKTFSTVADNAEHVRLKSVDDTLRDARGSSPNQDAVKIYKGLNRAPPASSPKACRRFCRNRRKSPLLRLPAELRLRIYDLVYRDTSIIIHVDRAFSIYGSESFEKHILHGFQNPWKPWLCGAAVHPLRSPLKPNHLPRLHLACKQLYQETAYEAHRCTAWAFTDIEDLSVSLEENILTLGERRNVRTLYSPIPLDQSMRKAFPRLEMLVLRDETAETGLRRQLVKDGKRFV